MKGTRSVSRAPDTPSSTIITHRPIVPTANGSVARRDIKPRVDVENGTHERPQKDEAHGVLQPRAALSHRTHEAWGELPLPMLDPNISPADADAAQGTADAHWSDPVMLTSGSGSGTSATCRR